ncbi:MAG: diaminopimelate decarboxylase [Alphaproteobacteria bacterium]|nr:diaminopimelate decarboxylase [Alphaproteobacteria bacterium]
MNHFEYRNGVLYAEEVPLPEIAGAVGTPFYCYATATLLRHFDVFKQALPQDTLIAYALKANSNLAVIRTLAREGAGADVVSEGEFRRALAAGVPPGRIVFSGVGKSARELAFALDVGLYQINVEGEPELELLSALAASKGAQAAITIRVNPDIDAKTHAKITTGKGENKFGVPWERARELYAKAARLPGLKVVGADVHIGSQITDLAPMEKAVRRVMDLVAMLREDGHAIARLDLGGGLGVPYDQRAEPPPLPAAYGEMVTSLTKGHDLRLIVEPGRLITGNAGILVAQVLYVKEGLNRRFLILDAGMNDLIRPTLYEAFHEIVPVRHNSASTRVYDVVGPVCESGDVFARDRELPEFAPGDLVAILTAGAYGAVQANEYNTRPLVPEVLVNGARMSVIRRRRTYEEILGQDHIPDWLA